MIKGLRSTIRFLESARLATWLLVFLGGWSVLATLVPQGDASDAAVTAWAAAHPLIDPVVRTVGLHTAFSALPFRACVFVLGLSTALCAWRRTKVALGRMRTLREAARSDAASLCDRADQVEVACGAGVSQASALETAAETLARLGVKTRRRDGLLYSVSPWWSVWGSPVFHWGLLAIMIVILVGSLQRSEGLMGVPVGQTIPDVPGSYGVLRVGPLHDWNLVHRSIRVDSFDTEFRTGDLDRGPTPTVSVLDANGSVIKTQRIFPNSPLQSGTLTIHPADFGFAVDVSLSSAAGEKFGQATQLVDISQTAADGTAPLRVLTLSNQAGQQQEYALVTVPLRREGGQFAVPQERTAHVVVASLDGRPVADRVLKPGEAIPLPNGDTLRVDAVGFYARLSVVDDGTISILYAAMAIAMLGLSLTVVSRQHVILVSADQGPDGVVLHVWSHLWRNVSTTRAEVQSELSRALHTDEGSVS